MDLTLLLYIVGLAVASIGVDTVLHPVSVVLDSAVPDKIDKLSANAATINQILKFEVDQVSNTPSVLALPEIRVGANQGIGMAIAEAASMKSVALALQASMGNQPEEIRLTLLNQNGKVRMLVNGAGPGGLIDTPPFQIMLTLRDNETLPALVHRAALAGLQRIDPYMTALHLLQTHVLDGVFTDVLVLIDEIKTQLPPTPRSYERSLFENLQGIINLFQHEPDQAQSWFQSAVQSNPDNSVAMLNVAFISLQLGNFRDAITEIQHLLTTNAPTDPILLATAYIEQAAGQLGLNDVNGADQSLAKAVQIYPKSAVAYELWTVVKRHKGDTAAAERMHQKALENSATFANYAEVAALYFTVPWRDNQPIMRSAFVNPDMMRFN
jgi:tetratricopeptide (TPR) repeat protein